MFDIIIHPTALTSADDAAFDHALAIAVALQSDLTILHVDPERVRHEVWQRFPGVRKRLIEWQLIDPDTSREDLRAKLNLSIRKVDTHSRNPVQATVDYVNGHDADLIVLASGGKQGLDRWLTPSISEPIGRSARTPCLFLPDAATGFVDPRNGQMAIHQILIPVNVEPDYWPAVQLATDFSREAGVANPKIRLLHVGRQVKPPSQRIDLPFTFESVEAEDPADAILTSAEDCDLIVMATEGHTGLLDAIRGSTTEQVIRKARCPVLTVPSKP
ncbi:MAG: universal stress protein [Proteobacteria bacterium]|nr:universal stress protein [Pseudomonadota bacterium]MDA1302342.1 universal stress protein [Pseudomonadota bacterium]